MWLSLVEYYNGVVVVVGSNPIIPIKKHLYEVLLFFIHCFYLYTVFLSQTYYSLLFTTKKLIPPDQIAPIDNLTSHYQALGTQ